MRTLLKISIILIVLISCGDYYDCYEQHPCDENYIYLYDIETKEKKVIDTIGVNSEIINVKYLNKTNSVIFGGGSRVTIISLDSMTTRSIRTPQNVLIWDQNDFDVSPDERYVVHDDNDAGTQGLYLLDLTTEETEELFYGTYLYNCVKFSNLGDKIAFTRTSDGREYTLHVLDINTRQLSKIETSIGQIKTVAFSENDEDIFYFKDLKSIWHYSFVTNQKEEITMASDLDFSIERLYYQKLLSVKDSVLYLYKYQAIGDNDIDLYGYSFDLRTKEMKFVSVGEFSYFSTDQYQLIRPICKYRLKTAQGTG